MFSFNVQALNQPKPQTGQTSIPNQLLKKTQWLKTDRWVAKPLAMLAHRYDATPLGDGKNWRILMAGTGGRGMGERLLLVKSKLGVLAVAVDTHRARSLSNARDDMTVVI